MTVMGSTHHAPDEPLRAPVLVISPEASPAEGGADREPDRVREAVGTLGVGTLGTRTVVTRPAAAPP